MNYEAVKIEDIKNMSIAELDGYAAYLREKIIYVTQKNGGHLASNLGTAELAIAFHRVFDLPYDSVIWDVGHQTYAHKFITGRGALMENLRKDGGASGFPSYKESEYDVFITGHSGTSLSMALGLARARDIKGEGGEVIAVIGDGSFTSGEIYEALNDLGDRPTKLIIILNDNKMSINRNVGAMSKYFNKLRVNKDFVQLKSKFKTDVRALPFVGKPLVKMLTGVKNKVKRGMVGNKFFEHFGLKYYGPYDGHNISQTIDALTVAKNSDKPVIIHLITQKGKGFADAELHPDAYHGISAQDEKSHRSMSQVAGETLVELASSHQIAVVTAAMTDGLKFTSFAQKYPKNFFDVAIAEQHAVSLCAGLAKRGVKPFFGVYSTFLQRGFDQIFDICLNDLPVVFLIDRAGAVGADGATHQGIFDLSYLSLIPNLAIASPKDGNELKELIKFAASYDHPIAIRYAKSYALDMPTHPIELGKWQTLKSCDSAVTVLAVGRTNELAIKTQRANVVNALFVCPLDEELLSGLSGTVITLEDNVIKGGFGEAVKSRLYGRCKVITLGHEDRFCDIRSIEKTYEASGLTVENLQKVIDSESVLLEKRKEL